MSRFVWLFGMLCCIAVNAQLRLTSTWTVPGSGRSNITGMAVDGQGNVVVVGQTMADNLATPGALQTERKSYPVFRLDGQIRPVSVPDTGAFYALSTAGTDAIWASTESGILRSLDAGATWQRVSLPSPAGSMVFAGADGENVCVGASRIRCSADGGATWRDVTPPAGAVTTFAMSPDRPANLVAVVADRTLVSRDGGRTWSDVAAYMMNVTFDRGRAGRVWATRGITVLRSDDEGLHWVEAGQIPASFASALLATQSRLYASDGSSLYVSADEGRTWRRAAVNLLESALAATGSGEVYVITPEGIASSTDGFSTTRVVPFEGLVGGHRIAVHPSGAVILAYGPSTDGFVTKFAPDGRVLWSTYLGGRASDPIQAIAVDPAGDIYVAAVSYSPDLAVSNDLVGTTRRGGTLVFKIAADGSAVRYSTRISGASSPTSIAVAADGRAAVGGYTSGPHPTTPGALRSVLLEPAKEAARAIIAPPSQSGFLSVLDPSGSSFVFSTYIGGANDDVKAIRFAEDGSVIASGLSLWAVAPDGGRLEWQTRVPTVTSLVRAQDGTTVVGGAATAGTLRDRCSSLIEESRDPLDQAAAFVARVDGNGDLSSCRLMGTGTVTSVGVDASGRIMAAGRTGWRGFPLREPFVGSVTQLGGFVSVQDTFTTYAGTGEDFLVSGAVVLADGSILVAGQDKVLQYRYTQSEGLRIVSVLDTASRLNGTVAPSSVIELTGTGFPESPTVTLGGGRVRVLSATSDRITVGAPDDLKPGMVEVAVGGAVNSVWVRAVPAAPTLFTYGGQGHGTALVFLPDGSLNTPENRAPAGVVLTAVLNGLPRAVPELKILLQARVLGTERVPAPWLQGAEVTLVRFVVERVQGVDDWLRFGVGEEFTQATQLHLRAN